MGALLALGRIDDEVRARIDGIVGGPDRWY
jgi:hypothetical protein